MKYAINIAREFGLNTIKTLFINSFDNEERWKAGIQSLCTALAVNKCLVEINTIERDDWRIAHIIFKEEE